MHSPDDIAAAERSQAELVFLMRGDIFETEESIIRLCESGKNVFVHCDLVKGLSRDEAGMKYYAERTRVSGILSTGSNLLKSAQTEGLYSIMRMFLVDTRAYNNSIITIETIRPDFVEVMPALIPRCITDLKNRIDRPLIAGGMISCYDDVSRALRAGAVGVSTSIHELWDMQ